MTILQVRLYHYKILAIILIIKSFRKEKLCSNEFYVIMDHIYNETSLNELWLSKSFSFSSLFKKKNHMFVGFWSLFLSILMGFSTSSITVKRNTKLLTFGPRTALVIKHKSYLGTSCLLRKHRYIFPCLQSQ